jgi:hypothetical protein
VAEWWREADNKDMHPVVVGLRPILVLQSLPLIAESLTPATATASDGGDGARPSMPFVPSDVGWVLAAAALILAIVVVLEAIARRRDRRSRTQVVQRRSDA